MLRALSLPRWTATLLMCALPVLLAGCETLSSITPWNTRSEDLLAREDPSTVPVEELYGRGVDALNAGKYTTAGRQFDLVEQTYPYASLATNALLMQAYSAYLENKYALAIGAVDRFIQLHPSSRDIAYAYYLRGLCFYEQIADVKRDQKGTTEAMGALQEVVNRFPDSSYARDARLKIDLARDHLAGKEMEIGRWYENQKIYGAAIGRFQRVVDEFQTTNHVAEALHRLTEIYLMLGLTEQATKTAAVLGHNYPGSKWYQESYARLAEVGQVPDAPTAVKTGRPGFFGRIFNTIF
ncbi:MAG: outer membrane protein assembly factor BamD [Acetobacteraceae bacterium]|nr:outer membrane protein assembly factor BamD [Acetobacteraceae bacterium]